MEEKPLSRRQFIKSSALAAAAFSSGNVFCTNKNIFKKPNIILIMADDMGFSDLGCYGSEIKTPNIDKLAFEGMRFSQFYNAARCCPTRASLLTGLYPHQAGMGGMVVKDKKKIKPGAYQGFLNVNCVTIAEVLKQAGYYTYMSGKWHVGEFKPHWPTNRGFDKYFGLISGAANYYDISKGKKEGIKRQLALDGEPYSQPKQNFYMTDYFTDYAVKHLEHHHNNHKDKPFFQYVAFTAPHWPLHALPEDIEKYKGKYLKGWDQLREERLSRLQKMGIIDKNWRLSPRNEEVTPWDNVRNKKEMAAKMAVYAAQIDRMDQGIGKILNKLDEIGERENTLILFLADNGACHEGGPWGFDKRKNGLPPGGVDSYMSYGRSWANASNTPFRMFKHWVHEGGIATPFIANWQSVIKSNQISHQVGHIIDVMATCCDVAGVDYPETFKEKKITQLEGKSLLPIFKGQKRNGHEALYWEHMKNKAVRQGKWKLVSKSGENWELYDLESDRTELNNLTEKFPEKVKKLKNLYSVWAEKCRVKK